MSDLRLGNFNVTYNKIVSAILVALFFSLPVWPRLTTILLFVFVIAVLFKIRKQHFANVLIHKEFLLFVLLYFLLIVGLSYSLDIKTGISKIQTQASFIVIPVILGGLRLNAKDRHTYLDAFSLGVLLTLVLCFIHAFYRFFTTNSPYVIDEFSRKNNIFFYNEFSGFLDLHPTYFSLYLGLAIFYLIHDFQRKSKFIFLPKAVLIVVFFIGLFFTSSKAGIFTFIALNFFYLIYQLLKHRKKTHLIALAALILGTLILLKIQPTLYQRSAQSLLSIQRNYTENKQQNESTGIRLGLWKLSYQISKDELLLGYGTGSVQKILNERCIEFNSFSSCESLRNKNSHNQYLNFLLSNGIIFVLLFVAALVWSLLKAIKQRDTIFIFFMIFLSLNFFFESLLQREKGIVFFTLFAVMLTISRTPLSKE